MNLTKNIKKLLIAFCVTSMSFTQIQPVNALDNLEDVSDELIDNESELINGDDELSKIDEPLDIVQDQVSTSNIVNEEFTKVDSFTTFSVIRPFSTVEAAGEYIKNQIVSGNYTVLFHITSTESIQTVIELINEAVYTHNGNGSEGDYIRFHMASYSGGYAPNGDGYDIELTYNMYATAEQQAYVDEEVTKILDSLELDGKSEYEIVKAIYDYITSHVVYDYDNLDDDAYTLKYTAYAALHDGTSVCQGYSNLFYKMALEAGLDARIISGQSRGENHSWNIVKIDDLYYDVDATWDAGMTEYHYFLKADSHFSSHTRNPYYTTTEFYEAYPMSGVDYGEVVSDSWASHIAQNFNSGNGTESNPYIITTPEQLALLADLINHGVDDYLEAHYQLGSNIDLSEYVWMPIGFYMDDSNYNLFCGHFNGAGYTISGLNITTELNKNNILGSYYGLFGYTYEAYIENVIIKDSEIFFTTDYATIDPFAGLINVGGIAAIADSTTIQNCILDMEINVSAPNTNLNVGGIVGTEEYSIIKESHFVGDITADAGKSLSVGGITGMLVDSEINTCSYIGNITSHNNGRIGIDEYDQAGYYMPHYAGGLVGEVSGTDEVIIKRSFANTQVNASSDLVSDGAGLIGTLETLEGSFKMEESYCKSFVNINDARTEYEDYGLITSYFGLDNTFANISSGYIKESGAYRFDYYYEFADITFDGNEEIIELILNNHYEFNPEVYLTQNGYYPIIKNSESPWIELDRNYASVSGKCGTNMEWTYYENGVLEFTGSGKMTDYDEEEVPWNLYKFDIHTIIMDDDITHVSNYAFDYMIHLQDVQLSESLKEIGDYCFVGCISLKELYIPESVNEISVIALYANASLEKITVDEDNEYFTSVDGVLFDKAKEILIKYPSNKDGNEYFIPVGTLAVDQYGFENTQKLETVHFPIEFMIIATYSFRENPYLTNLYFYGEQPDIYQNAFENMTLNIYYNNQHEWDLSDADLLDGDITWIPFEHEHDNQVLYNKNEHWFTCRCGEIYGHESHELSDWVEIEDGTKLQRTCTTCEYNEVKPKPDGSILYGDINDDGKVNSFDRNILARSVANWDGYDINNYNAAAADVNLDGKVNSFDRNILARHVANWDGYETLPYGK